MSDSISSTLFAFKSFVASIEYEGDDLLLAAKLGEAKALWAQAVSSLPCMWKLDKKEPMRASQAGSQLLMSLGLVKKATVDRRF